MSRRKVVTILGTRPEVIKMAPVVRELAGRPSAFDQTIVATAQHRQMLDQVLEVFKIQPDIDLGLMQQNQDLGEFASRSLLALSNLFEELKPDAILVQGDPPALAAVAWSVFYRGVRLEHVKAGLGYFFDGQPFPEKINRRLAGCLAD